MKEKTQPFVIALEILGGLLIVMSLWVDEVLNVHHLLFGALQLTPELEELMLETSLALIGLVVMVSSTLYLFIRIKKLESFIVMCAWCRKIKLDNEWISFEDYLVQKQNLETSHGICPTCAEEQITAFEAHARR